MHLNGAAFEIVGVMPSGFRLELPAETYALRDITTDLATHKNPPPTLSDLKEVLLNMQGAENLAATSNFCRLSSSEAASSR